MPNVDLALNPLPWILDTSFHLDEPSLTAGFSAASACGFRAVQADVPEGFTVSEYQQLLDRFELAPAPGYFGVPITGTDSTVVASARRHAQILAELGLTITFLAADLVPERMSHPGRGFTSSEQTLSTGIDRIQLVVETMVGEGVRPALHPHVGTWIETEAECRAVLDTVDADILAFGPDTGHLFWAGIDPALLIADYLDRVTGVHLKDVSASAVRQAQAADADYWQATQQQHVWTEPGRGNIDLDACLALLATAENLKWCVIEVDVPNIGTAEQSTQHTADWIRDQPGLAGGLR